ncbi:hypothetical protein [Sandarakinorhabdus rubra]|uniref:hypothetical protein n=1 Tax=Sandarakinorhabdus rubra TaxID=2672568 RepID=UPI0013D9191B|nr:hypothetical protein [Sandarakinorhabdus rubra]
MSRKETYLAAPKGEFTKILQIYIRLRFECRSAFPEVGHLPGAWDVLLDMALAQQLDQPFRITDAESAAGGSAAMALRALKALLEAKMISRDMHTGYAKFRVDESTLGRLQELLTSDYSH